MCSYKYKFLKKKGYVELHGELHKLSNYISYISKYSLGESGSLIMCAFTAYHKSEIKHF